VTQKTHTAQTLRRIIGKGTAKAFSERSGFSRPAISRILAGIHLVDRDNLDLLINAVEDPKQKAELVEAWIRDQLPGVVGQALDVTVYPLGDTAAKHHLPKLTPQNEELMRYWWREIAKDPQVGVTLFQLRAMRG
jgi:hypothetical protein